MPLSSIVFNLVKTLVFQSTTLPPLRKEFFSPLMALEVLRINNSNIPGTTFDMMDPFGSTLRELYIEEPIDWPNDRLMLRHWFGGWLSTTSGITITHIRYPLFDNRIQGGSFASASQLGVLNLTACQIETIAATAFDGMHSLMLLILDYNRLQTIASGTFDSILPNYQLYVQMSQNAWLCDCDMCYLRRITQQYWNNFERYKTICAVSEYTREPMWPYCEMECAIEMNSTTSTTPTSPASNETEVEAQVFISQQCQGDTFPHFVEVVKITARSRAMRIEDNNDGTVNVTVRLRPNQWQTTLVWFDNSNKHFQSVLPPSPGVKSDDCIDEHAMQLATERSVDEMKTTNMVYTMTVDIRPLVPYTFCVMANISEPLAVSPFNCMSFTKINRDYQSEYVHPWFTDETRGFTIGMLTVGVVMCMILGAALGYFMLRKWACCRRWVMCKKGRRESGG